MAKVLKIAAIVVGVAALVVSGAILVVGPAAAAAITIGGISLATLGTALAVTATVLSVAGGLMTKKPKLPSSMAGTQLEFSADPVSGIPYFMGKGACGMDIVHEASWGDKNRDFGMVGIMSLGAIFAYNAFVADGTAVSFSSGNAVGYYNNFMYLHTQLGAQPESAALNMTSPDALTMPDWGSAYKLSGLAAAGIILIADVDNGKIFSGGLPKMWHEIQGVLGYDPRSDSTNGGSGSQRPLTESTYAYSDNPWVHHGTYALGRFQGGVRMMGPGIPSAKIDWASHIEAANIATANGWKISGRIMSTDPKWEVLKAIAQAGGGYPIPNVAKLAVLVNTPRVSADTIEEEDVRGGIQVPQMVSRRDRINGAIPRIRMKDHAWEVTPGNTVRNSTYLSEDGGNEHTREVELALVADVGDGAGLVQAAQLAAYDVANSREKIGISVELGIVWGQYKAGDCLTLNLPKANLVNQKCIVIGRTFNATRNTVTLEFRTETDAKHTWALGQSGGTTTPPTVVTPPGTGDIPPPPTLDQIQTALRTTYPAGTFVADAIDAGSNATIRLHGATVGSSFQIQYPGFPVVTHAAVNLTGKAYSTLYFLYFDIDAADAIPDATPTFGATTVYADAINSAAHPYRVFLSKSVTTPAAGGGTTTGGGTGGGYGGGGFDVGGGGGSYYP